MESAFIKYIKHTPFFRPVISLISGIIFQLNIPTNSSLYLILICIFLILFFISKSYEQENSYNKRHINGTLIFILIFLLGGVLTSIRETKPFEIIDKEIIASGTINEPIVEKEKTFKTEIKLNYIKTDSIYSSSNKKITVYFNKSSEAKEIEYGDQIIFKNYIQEIKNNGNPDEFDYASFVKHKGISGQVFLKNNDWKIICKTKGNFLFSASYDIRSYVTKIYKGHNILKQDLAVLQALTLGDKSDIDPETKQSFSISGAMHILAVSGLHVGIFFLLFHYCLNFLTRIKYKEKEIGKHIKTVLIIALLWCFAIISGLSPSVCRAALMFSFLAVGLSLNRKTDIYNSLASSAFVLLVFDPYQITNVGFQLSYCAVLSIVFFQPRIAKLFFIKNKVLNYIWSLTAVSVAAQIGTFPFSLFYFNIFPNYFFLTNILVIPLATLILYFAILLTATSFIPYISDIFAFILKYLVKSLNFSVKFIESIPFSYSENIHFKETDVIFAFLFILSITSIIVIRRSKQIITAICILIIWVISGFINDIFYKKKEELIVYNINNETAVNIIGDKNFLLGKISLNDPVKIKYGMKNHFIRKSCTDYQFVDISRNVYKEKSFYKKDNFLITNDCIVVIFNEDKKYNNYSFEKKYEVDYIIISDNVVIDPEQITNQFKFKKIIFDSSNNYRYLKAYEQKCYDLNIPFHSVRMHGAFIVNL